MNDNGTLHDRVVSDIAEVIMAQRSNEEIRDEVTFRCARHLRGLGISDLEYLCESRTSQTLEEFYEQNRRRV